VISARAGGVNYVEGRVTVMRSDATDRLIRRNEVGIGERVQTGPEGKAEFLLNPGSFLRVGPSTAFEFTSTSLDNLKINLFSGSAIFEVIADDDFRISVTTPKSELNLTRSGVYRIDVSEAGIAKVSVIKGKVILDEDSKVKAGRSATLDGGGASFAKFDTSSDDPFEGWSKARAKELAKTNSSLQRNVLRSSLLNSYMSRGWNVYNSFGLWIFDPSRHMWCFLPFGTGWGSPYGYYYGLDTWNCGLPRWVYNQPSQPLAPGASQNPAKEPAVRPIDNGDTHGRYQPPFQQIQNNERGGGEGVVNRRIGLPRGDEGVLNPPSSPGGSSMPSSGSVSAPPPAASTPSISLPSRIETKEKP